MNLKKLDGMHMKIQFGSAHKKNRNVLKVCWVLIGKSDIAMYMVSWVLIENSDNAIYMLRH